MLGGIFKGGCGRGGCGYVGWIQEVGKGLGLM